MNLDDSTVLVTGGSSGIGLALAHEFAARGATVLICGRDEARLDEARRNVPGSSTFVADVSLGGDRKRLVDWVTREHPRTNVLVNNAGMQLRVTVGDSSEPDIRELAVNLEAPIDLTHRMLTLLRAAAADKREAVVINVTSGLGYVPLAASPVYAATKAGLQAYTRALRTQLDGTGVTVVDLAPPAVDTPLLAGAQQSARKGGPPTMSPVDFAAIAVRRLRRGRTDIRVGGAKLLYVLDRVAPRTAVRLLNSVAS